MWSPPVAVGFVLNRRRLIICGRLVWPSGAWSHDGTHEIYGDWRRGFRRRCWFSAWSAEGGVVLSHVDLERYFSQPHGGHQLFVRDSVD
ncbi:hypothetical protein F2Q68_00033683 [Brassica cretica]|uniref:Uncharacterized protein n=1 Tax=Brassica cretica TaxID=69181 RepID=A0A8S9H3G7_BRACR|nr:hypothetical protein F2Q68_00033683 [Brassica cretica]